MKIRWGRVILTAFLLLVLYGVGVFFVPEFNAESWREPLAKELEKTLDRKVTLGDVHYQLWPSPGLTATNLVIADDPKFGIEPFAYVTELQAGLRWWPLFAGRVELASVRLMEASLNISREEGAGWNFVGLLANLRQDVRTSSAPSFALRGGRINFRQGVQKSSYYLNDVDIDLAPPGTSSEPLRWSYEASPARTDRSEAGFGRVTGSGTWTPNDAGGIVDIEAELEPSAATEVSILLSGRDIGLQGRIASRARLTGPVSNIVIRGVLTLENPQHNPLLPFRDRDLPLPYEGTIDVGAQRLELNTGQPAGRAPLPFSAQLSVKSLLSDPEWNFALRFNGLSAALLLDLSKRLGANLPAGFSLQGSVFGALDFARGNPGSGALEVKELEARLDGEGPAQAASAQIQMEGSTITMSSTQVQFPPSGQGEPLSVSISGAWSSDVGLAFAAELDRLPWNGLRRVLSRLPASAPLPFVENCQDGAVSGSLRFSPPAIADASGAGTWDADLVLLDVDCRASALTDPLQVSRASLVLRGPAWSVKRGEAHAGQVKFQFNAQNSFSLRRPIRFEVVIPETSTAQLSAALRPLFPARAGFLERNLPFRRSAAPAWLREVAAEGHLSIGVLDAGDSTITAFRSRLFWDGDAIELPQWDAAIDGAKAGGHLRIRVGAQPARWEMRGLFEDFSAGPWLADAEFEASAQGPPDRVPATLRSSGMFHVRAVPGGESPVRTASGAFDYDAQRSAHWLFRSLDASAFGEILTGDGSTRPDGTFFIDLTGPLRTLRLAGTVDPFRIESSESPRSR